MQRTHTFRKIFEDGVWLTSEQLRGLQPNPLASDDRLIEGWKRRNQVFSVSYDGKDYFPRYQFDARYQPLPLVEEVLAVFGPVEDTWTLAAWFHFPSPWLVERDDLGATNIAPNDAIDQREALVSAAAKRLVSYVA